MSTCPQCGAVARPTDRFCNSCGTPIARPSGPAEPSGAAYNAPAPPPLAPLPEGWGDFGAAPPPRCQLGHDIAPGSSYCAAGHPIALDQMQFASEAYGGSGFVAPPRDPYGTPAPPPQAPFGAPAQPVGFGTVNDTSRDATPPPEALTGFLVAFGVNASGDFWPLRGGRRIVGRAGTGDGLDIPLQDPTISSRHAAMVVDSGNGTVAVEDTGSTNGTFVNDEHIGFSGRRDLRDGDRVRFGAFTTIVKVIGRP